MSRGALSEELGQFLVNFPPWQLLVFCLALSGLAFQSVANSL